jgi:hypothetical protein
LSDRRLRDALGGSAPLSPALSEAEREREADLLSAGPARAETALDVGTRHGRLARRLTERCERVVALDIVQRQIDDPRVEFVQGDVRSLPFRDASFDLIVCAEVLEHLPPESLDSACRELVRVTRCSLIVGVPYRQDLRVGATSCAKCQAVNPPWGHVNAFDEDRLRRLFSPLAARFSYVGSTRAFTNPVSAALLDYAGNPFGTYHQEEPCVRCGAVLVGPRARSPLQRVATRTAFVINRVQRSLMSARARWVHVHFTKNVSDARVAGSP